MIEGDSRRPVEFQVGGHALHGDLVIPSQPRGLVLFAHGSGSSRHSPRNRQVASALNAGGMATLLFDLLDVDEELDRANVFDIGLLAARLAEATQWARSVAECRDLPIGYFGASTGAAAALAAAANLRRAIGAVVSRGGRPDLALEHVGEVTAATLLIVGGRDEAVLRLNRMAQECLRCEHRLEIVPGATHLFEERGALEAVEDLALAWFNHYLSSSLSPAR